MPDAFIGVDVIVGTRGETEEYFEQAYQFISGLDVTQLHVFSYSERPGTQALKIDYVAVSYTHLDVYKRQFKDRLCQK